MSDFPEEITKHILSAPPRIRRSTRYSDTAQGRSTPSFALLPTGRSSLENASGCIRLPRPAAGMMPHISSFRGDETIAFRPRRSLEQVEQLGGTLRRAVLVQGSLAGAARHRKQFTVIAPKPLDYLVSVSGSNYLIVGTKKTIQTFPSVADDRSAAGCRLEQSTGRTPSHLRHGASGYVEGQPRRAEEGGVLGRRQMANEIDIRRPGKILRVLRTPDQEPATRAASRRRDQQRFQRSLTIFRIGSKI